MSRDDRKSCYSYSRTTCFGHCKYEYYLDYVINDDDLYLSEGNYYAEVGSFVHDILAKVFLGEISQDDAAQYFVDHYDDNVCYKVRQSTMDKNFELIADYFANLDISWLKNYDIIGVELQVNFKVDNDDFIGFIDLLLRDKKDGRIVVLDHKSSEYPFKQNGTVKKKSEQSFETYKKQMYLYCHAVKQLYGEFPKQIVWNHFKDGGKLAIIPFIQREYDEAISWFRDTLKTIKKEKDFEATTDFFYCNNLCNFRASCEYAKAERDK